MKALTPTGKRRLSSDPHKVRYKGGAFALWAVLGRFRHIVG